MCVSVPAEVIAVEPRNTRGWPRTKQQLAFALNVIQLTMKPYPAMMAAGYSQTTAHIKSHKLAAQLRPFFTFLQERRTKVAAAHYDATTTRILHEMSAIGLQNVKDYIRVVKVNGGIRLIGKPVTELTEPQALAIESWEAVPLKTDDGEELDYKYVLHDKASALVNLGKHLGMFSEKLMLDMNMRQTQARAIDFSALPQDKLEAVIKLLEGIQEDAAKARAIEGEYQPVS